MGRGSVFNPNLENVTIVIHLCYLEYVFLSFALEKSVFYFS